MSIDALTQAKSTLEGVRGALGIYSKTEVDMTLGMLDRAIAKYTSLDAICQDLQEKTYTQAMRIAELEAKLAEAEKQEPVAWQWRRKDKAWSLDNTFNSEVYPTTLDSEVRPLYTHPQPKREPLTDEQILRFLSRIDECAVRLPRGLREFARAVEAAHGITSDMKQEHVDKTAKQRHEENT